MFSIINRQRPVCGLLALTIFLIVPLQSSCTLQSDSPTRNSGRNYRIISHTKETPRSFASFRELSGRYTVAFEGREPHEVAYYVRHFVTRGEGDVTLEVIDETTGASTVFTANEETSAVTIQNTIGAEQFVIHPDESITVGGTMFPAGAWGQAAIHLAASETMATVSAESLAVVHEVLDTEVASNDDSSRGGGGGGGNTPAIAFIVFVSWTLTSSIICTGEYRRKGCNTSALSNYCKFICRIDQMCFC